MKKIPECDPPVTVHTVALREACYCSQHAAFWRGVNSNILRGGGFI